MAVSSLSLQLLERLADRQLPAREPIESRGAAWRRRLGLRTLLDLHERQLAADLVQPVFDGGIADAEVLLHLLDRSVATHERRDEYLILGGELGERRQLETAVNRDALLDEPNPLDLKSCATAELGERLPVKKHN